MATSNSVQTLWRKLPLTPSSRRRPLLHVAQCHRPAYYRVSSSSLRQGDGCDQLTRKFRASSLQPPYRVLVRFLYTPESLGMDKFIEQREKVRTQFGSERELYLKRVREYFCSPSVITESSAGSDTKLEKGSASHTDENVPAIPGRSSFAAARRSALASSNAATVFTEDLKNVVSLCETDDDIDLCVRMIRRFNEQNRALRFGSFVFGPVAIRLLYHLDKPDLAIEMLKDPQLAGFFDQFTSYQIAMDLLYKKGRYQDVVELYEHMRNQQLHGTRFPRDCGVLVLGACYHIGTRQSYDFAMQLIREARQSGALVLRKGLTFTAALALRMNEPKAAMELLALTAQINYITVRNLRLIALSHLDRYEDIFLVLRSIVHQYHHMRQGDSEICQDTIDRIRENLERKQDSERLQLFSQLQRALKEGNHISTWTIDKLLNRPMQHKSRDTNPPLAMFKDHRDFPSPVSPDSGALHRAGFKVSDE